MISRVVRLTKACDFCGFCGKISYFFLQTIYKLVPKTKYKINKSETISCVMEKVEMENGKKLIFDLVNKSMKSFAVFEGKFLILFLQTIKIFFEKTCKTKKSSETEQFLIT